MIPKSQRLIAVFWPSFIMAGLGVIVFFSAIDPSEMLGPSWLMGLDRLEIYTAGFLFFWALTLCACWLTCYFQRPEGNI